MLTFRSASGAHALRGPNAKQDRIGWLDRNASQVHEETDRFPDGPHVDVRVMTAVSGPTWRRTVLRVSVLYTALTVITSGYALAAGHSTDTHTHLLLRLGFVCVGIAAVDLYDVMRRRAPRLGKWVSMVVAYSASVVVVMSGMWLWGAAGGDLHPDAFRDGFLNFTGVGVVLAMTLAVVDRVRGGHRSTDAA